MGNELIKTCELCDEKFTFDNFYNHIRKKHLTWMARKTLRVSTIGQPKLTIQTGLQTIYEGLVKEAKEEGLIK